MGKFVIFVPILLLQGKYLAEASVGKANASQSIPKEQSMSEEERHYYLPMQTMFAQTGLVAGGVSTTSPPHLTIQPAPPIEMAHSQRIALPQEGAHEVSQCVSETPIIELESRFLLPSKSVIREMSGHLEIPSKTEGGVTPEIVPSPSSAAVTTTDPSFQNEML